MMNKLVAAVAMAAPLMAAGVAAQAQTYGYSPQYYAPPQAYSQYDRPCGSSCGNHRPRYNSYNGQADRPGDFRCDAYWDRGRTDCDARWRDQRTYRSHQSYGYSSGYAYGGTQVYAGQYGRPDVVYSGGQYGYGGGYPGGAYADPYGHDHSGYGVGGRDPQRINWCCAQFRSYDPRTGFYTAYSGHRVFCG